MDLVLVIFTTFILLPTLNLIHSKLESVPTDNFGAALALLISSAGVVDEMTNTGELVVSTAFLVVIIFVIFSIICLGAYVTYRTRHSNPDDKWASWAYGFSLFFSMFLLLFSIVHILNLENIYGVDPLKPGAAYEIANNIFSTDATTGILIGIPIIFLLIMIAKKITTKSETA